MTDKQTCDREASTRESKEAHGSREDKAKNRGRKKKRKYSTLQSNSEKCAVLQNGMTKAPFVALLGRGRNCGKEKFRLFLQHVYHG